MTGSSGHSRPSGRSTLTKWNPALDPPEGFGTEGKRTLQTVPCTDRAVLLQLLMPHHHLTLGLCGTVTSEFLKEAVCCPSLEAAWGCSLLGGILCVHSESGNWFLLMQICSRQRLWYRKTDSNVLNWRSVLSPTELGSGTMTSFLLAFVINTEDPN